MSKPDIKSPEVGSRWTDCDGRELTIQAVYPGDPGGRQVVGTIGDETYSCTLPAWADIWRDQAPRWQGRI